jgi:hypothetical protein
MATNFFFFFFVCFETGAHHVARLIWNSCLTLHTARITAVKHHALLPVAFMGIYKVTWYLLTGLKN